jgi:hypothetical protein
MTLGDLSFRSGDMNGPESSDVAQLRFILNAATDD